MYGTRSDARCPRTYVRTAWNDEERGARYHKDVPTRPSVVRSGKMEIKRRLSWGAYKNSVTADAARCAAAVGTEKSAIATRLHTQYTLCSYRGGEGRGNAAQYLLLLLLFKTLRRRRQDTVRADIIACGRVAADHDRRWPSCNWPTRGAAGVARVRPFRLAAAARRSLAHESRLRATHDRTSSVVIDRVSKY